MIGSVFGAIVGGVACFAVLLSMAYLAWGLILVWRLRR